MAYLRMISGFSFKNIDGNRNVIHCTSIAGQTFFYCSVAGVNVNPIEQLSNPISGKFQSVYFCFEV